MKMKELLKIQILLFKYINRIIFLNEIRVDESLPKPSGKSLTDIIINEILKYEHIKIINI